MPQPYRHWTEEEEKALVELKQQGKPASVIEKLLKRTEVSVVDKMAVMKQQGIL